MREIAERIMAGDHQRAFRQSCHRLKNLGIERGEFADIGFGIGAVDIRASGIMRDQRITDIGHIDLHIADILPGMRIEFAMEVIVVVVAVIIVAVPVIIVVVPVIVVAVAVIVVAVAVIIVVVPVIIVAVAVIVVVVPMIIMAVVVIVMIM